MTLVGGCVFRLASRLLASFLLETTLGDELDTLLHGLMEPDMAVPKRHAAIRVEAQ